MLNLPDDIIFIEILPRISSINSLLRFKSVSKSWRSLISNKSFAITQLEKSSAKGTTRAVMISLNDEYFAVNHCSVDELFSQQDIHVDQFEIDYRKFNFVTAVAGCCDGLYCILLAQKHFILMNPHTRKYHKLPRLADVEAWIQQYGFGESNNDYKVFAQYNGVAKLYSFKTNSWKTVQGPYVYGFRKGVFLNGKLHWAMRSKSDAYYFYVKIVTFDLGSEVTGVVIESPIFAHSISVDLIVIQGCLCVPYCNFSNNITDVWIMKEYGVKESWCKLLTLPDISQALERQLHMPILISQKSEVLVKFISQKGEILVKFGNDYFIYDTITVSYLSVSQSRVVCDIDIGTQSLISPFPPGEPNE